jgi:hypothetical protein
MWPFKKKKDLVILPIDQQKWSMIEVKGGEAPMLIRLNESAREFIGHPDLGVRVGFAIPLLQPNKTGLPDPDENLKLNEIEDFIISAMLETGPMMQVLAIAAGEFKEFVFQIKNSEGIESAHKKAQSAFLDYEIQCIGELDPNWQAYQKYSNA